MLFNQRMGSLRGQFKQVEIGHFWVNCPFHENSLLNVLHYIFTLAVVVEVDKSQANKCTTWHLVLSVIVNMNLYCTHGLTVHSIHLRGLNSEIEMTLQPR